MSSRLRPKISETDRRYCACLWWPRRLTKMPTSWSSAATSRRSRSRLPSPCSPLSSSKRRIARRATWRGGGGAEREGAPALELVEEADREARDLAGVGGVEAVALAEGGGGGEDLAREGLHPPPPIRRPRGAGGGGARGGGGSRGGPPPPGRGGRPPPPPAPPAGRPGSSPTT